VLSAPSGPSHFPKLGIAAGGYPHREMCGIHPGESLDSVGSTVSGSAGSQRWRTVAVCGTDDR
jgi:hypothetical protein